MTPELETATAAAKAGGEIVHRYFREGTTIRSKEAYNLVSDADLDSERACVEVIQRRFPDHVILGEELHSGSVDAEHLWIVDPLDGTNNFAHELPHFAVSVAYYRDGQPQCGAVWNPIRDDLYLASRGSGATHNGQALHVGAQSQLSEVLVGVGFYYDRGAMMESTLSAVRDLFRQNIHGIRRFGTASLDLCQVASGCFGAFFEYELAPWDFAAGRLILEEAGGQCTTCRGEALPISKTSILASNGRLHGAMLDIVGTHHPSLKQDEPR